MGPFSVVSLSVCARERKRERERAHTHGVRVRVSNGTKGMHIHASLAPHTFSQTAPHLSSCSQRRVRSTHSPKERFQLSAISAFVPLV